MTAAPRASRAQRRCTPCRLCRPAPLPQRLPDRVHYHVQPVHLLHHRPHPHPPQPLLRLRGNPPRHPPHLRPQPPPPAPPQPLHHLAPIHARQPPLAHHPPP